jgi:hypothetical protein
MSEWTANATDCLRGLIGRRVTGVINPWPLVTGIATAKGLVLDDGTALIFTSNGSFWRERAEEVQRVVKRKQDELQQAASDLQHALVMDGLLPAVSGSPESRESTAGGSH